MVTRGSQWSVMRAISGPVRRALARTALASIRLAAKRKAVASTEFSEISRMRSPGAGAGVVQVIGGTGGVFREVGPGDPARAVLEDGQRVGPGAGGGEEEIMHPARHRVSRPRGG